MSLFWFEIVAAVLALVGNHEVQSYRVEFQAFDASEPLLRYQEPLQLHVGEESSRGHQGETLGEMLLSMEGNVPMGNLSEVCHAIMHNLAEQGGDYMRCLLDHARPFRLCERCVVHYTQFTSLYKVLLDDKKCAPALLLADRMQVLTRTYAMFTSTWSDADCQICYQNVEENSTTGEVSFNYTADTRLFQQMHHNVTHCFNDSNTIDENGVNRVCTDCLGVYKEMNSKFSSLQQDSDGHICMDLVDMMNYTRLMWSTKFGCRRPLPDASIVITLSVLIFVITILLYLTSKFIAKIRMPQIFKAKRMATGSTSGRYGSLSGEVDTSLPRFPTFSPTRSTAASVERRRVDSNRDVDGNGLPAARQRSL